jgi:hypothetical protein
LLAGLDGEQLVARPSFFQLDNVRKARARGESWHLIVHEDVLIFRAPLTAAGSARRRESQPGQGRPLRAAPDRPGDQAA